MNNSRIIVALDYADPALALNFLDGVDASTCRVKIGKELFCRGGPQLVEKVCARGFDVFLDLKFHDIPNTVAQACLAAAELGVWMMNVHASGGLKMMTAARAALTRYVKPPLLIAVTVLTSLGAEDLTEIGWSGTPAQNVLRLAELACLAGMDGVVCSPQEVTLLRTALGHDFCLVTPGIRPAGLAQDDQNRIMTPGEAIRSGASYLVIGRPITAASNPLQALLSIQTQIDKALLENNPTWPRDNL